VTEPARETPGVRAAVLVAGLVPLVAYGFTLHPGLPAGDSGELIAVAATGGVAHPPGYPLYTMLAGVFGRLLPLGSFAWRLNLLSALASAVAAGVLAAAVARAARSAPAGVVAGWVLGFAGPALSMALVAEVFALNALLGSLALLALTFPPRAALPALAGLSSLALSHHHTLLLLAVPALAVTGVSAWREPGPRHGRRALLLRAAGAALAGLLPLLWLPFASERPSAFAWGETHTLRGFLAHLLRVEYGTFRLDAAGAGLEAHGGHLVAFARAIPAGLGWLASALALAGGLTLAGPPQPPLALALTGFLALQLVFFTRIGFPAGSPLHEGVVERFHVLPFLVLAFVAGLGAARLTRPFRDARARRLAWVALAAGVLLSAWPTLRERSERGNRFTDSLGRGVLASLPRGAVLFVEGDLVHNALLHLTRVERLRPDVTVLDQQLMSYAWYVRRARRAHPGLLPDFTDAERVRLADGRTIEGLAIARADGTTDLLWEDGHATLPASQVAARAPADPALLYARTRADFRRGALLDAGEDRYSGFPGSRNLRWLDHLAGSRPVAFLGVREDSYALRYMLAPSGLVNLALPRGDTLATTEALAAAARVIEAAAPGVRTRRYLPTSFETSEGWRWSEFASRAEWLLQAPGLERDSLAARVRDWLRVASR
jgi:hypothetical protein